MKKLTDLFRWFLFAWRNRQHQKCDGCTGNFRAYELSATSGDWWLCPKCYRSIWS